jgi:hypothetical protein
MQRLSSNARRKFTAWRGGNEYRPHTSLGWIPPADAGMQTLNRDTKSGAFDFAISLQKANAV